MTSVPFNVGLGDSSRNSSKVLKPPGGGSSDIFGVGEAQQSPRKVKQYMASNISLTDGVPAPSGPGSTSSAASTSSGETTPSPPTGSPTRNEGNPVTGEGYAKPAAATAPARNRVPPGGYSSGLW